MRTSGSDGAFFVLFRMLIFNSLLLSELALNVLKLSALVTLFMGSALENLVAGQELISPKKDILINQDVLFWTYF